jgi:hypothetical protein
MRFDARSLTLVVPTALLLALVNRAVAQNVRGVDLGRTQVSEVIANRGAPLDTGTMEDGVLRYISYAGVTFYFSERDSIIELVRVTPSERLTRAAALRRLGRPSRTKLAETLGYWDSFGDSLNILSSAEGIVQFLDYSPHADRDRTARLIARGIEIRKRHWEDSVREAESLGPAPLVAFGEIVVGAYQPAPTQSVDKGGYVVRRVPAALIGRGLHVGDVVLEVSRVDSTGARITVEVGDPVVRRLGGWQAAWYALAPAHADTVEIYRVHRDSVLTVYMRHRETPQFRAAKANAAVTWALLERLAGPGRPPDTLTADTLVALRRRAVSSPEARARLDELARAVNRDSILRSFQLKRRSP